MGWPFWSIESRWGLRLETYVISEGQAPAGPVDAPARRAVAFIKNILEFGADPVIIIDLNSPANIQEQITRNRVKKRYRRITIDNKYAIYHAADRQHTILYLCKGLTSCCQRTAGGSALTARANRRYPANASAATKEILYLCPRTCAAGSPIRNIQR